MNPPAKLSNRLDLLDYSRFIAAVAVVLFHYTYAGIIGGKIGTISSEPWLTAWTQYGYLGVDFFFLISGYVIFFSAQSRNAADFAVARLVRLYPVFWLCLLITTCFAITLGGPDMEITLNRVLINTTMVAKMLGGGFVDGVYWTLEWELCFYFMVACLLFLGLQKRLTTCFLIWPFLMIAAALAGVNHWPFLGGYYCYFAGGAVFAILKKNTTWPAVLAVLACLGLSLWRSYHSLRFDSFGTGVVLAIICCQFLFFVFLNSKTGSQMELKGSRLAGAITYPLYLIHAHVGYMIFHHYASDNNKYIAWILVALGVTGVSILLHLYYEKPTHAFWKKVFQWTVGLPLGKLESMFGNLRNRSLQLMAPGSQSPTE